MVRKIHIDAVDDAPRNIIAVGNDYPNGHLIAPHSHRRGQLISSLTGTLVLTTPHGTWVTPPQRGLWIPPCTLHHVQVIGIARMQSLYLEPDAASGLPQSCQVVAISPFMRALLSEALDLPVLYDLKGRAGALMTLIQHELLQLPVLPLSLPMPSRADLAERCRTFLASPNAHDDIEGWCASLAISRRSFTRLFRQQTGLSFMAWRQQACLMAALPRLAAGDAITTIAIDMGYDNPSAFSAMFKKLLGVTPRSFLAAPLKNPD